MPKGKEIVINTGPIIALVAALSDLSILRSLYRRVLISYEASKRFRLVGQIDLGPENATILNYLGTLFSRFLILKGSENERTDNQKINY